jgi:hypothetical protein
MADPSYKIAVDGLEFYEIKSRLKDFLSSQDKFKDYNFEGSGLGILLDLLAYNTHYINYYSNMVANEMFLDSATVRDSVVSHAKLLGYTPTSNRGARAILSVTVPANADGSVDDEFLPKYSVFSANAGTGANTYNFLTTQMYKLEPKEYDVNGITTSYWIPELEVIEGRATVSTFIVDRTNKPAQKFVIPQENVDISTLKVRVQAATTDISGYDEYWTLVTDPLQLGSDSKVYFVQETENRKFEIYFGDDIVGKGLKNGNVVILEYLVTSNNPAEANDIGANETENLRAFVLEGASFPASTETVVVSPALGGATRESVQSIKYYAPRGFQAQDRAVTVEDYAFTLAKDYPFAESIYVWGGEDNTPPVYGRVFVSIKPVKGTTLTNQEKEAIKSGILKKYNVVGVIPEIVDPDYTYLRFQTTLKMNTAKTAKSITEIKQLVKSVIESYVTQNLGKFGGNLLLSRLTSVIDATDPSIQGSSVLVTLEKQVNPVYGTDSNYTVAFSNPLQPGTLSTNAFLHFDPAKVNFDSPYSVAYLVDDKVGGVSVVTYESLPNTSGGTTTTQKTRVLKKNAGKVNYSSGQVDLPNFNISGLAGENPLFKIFGQPSNYGELAASKNQLFTTNTEDPTANTVDVQTSTNALKSPAVAKNPPKITPSQTTTTSTPVASQTNNIAQPAKKNNC